MSATTTEDRRTVTGERVIAAIATAIIVHELTAEPDDLITAVYRRWRTRNPRAAIGFILITAAHLLGLLPPPADPYAIAHRARNTAVERWKDR